MNKHKFSIQDDGFEEIFETLPGRADLASATCSGSRSDCCTRVCSRDANFVATEEDWDAFLKVEGGQVQY